MCLPPFTLPFFTHPFAAMSWERILQNDAGATEPLLPRIEALFAQQRSTWPALREGEAALRYLQTRTLTSDGERIVVQVNPARRRSTQAKVDSQSIAARPCFLCPDNMPPEERGVAFEDLVILPNPFPILPKHCTIADRAHRPQQLTGRVDTLLRLAAAIGPDMAAFYNGPRCGASAPDHFHFQASSAADIPILAQLPSLANGHQRVAHSGFGRSLLVFASPNSADVQADVERTIDSLGRLENTNAEPMFNLLACFRAGRYVVVLFPRAAHRPACYLAKGPERIAVSPAVLEMSGILVVTDPQQFDRVDAATAEFIYKQVSIAGAEFEALVASLGDTP